MGDKFDEYNEKIAAGKRPGVILDEMGIKRYCCRRMLLTHLDIVDETIAFRSIK